MKPRAPIALALLALAWPAAALANPGPDPGAALALLGLTGVQLVAALVVLFATPQPSGTPWLALGFTFLGLGATAWWPAALAFQAPAGLLLLLGSRATNRAAARSAGMLAFVLTLLVLPWATYRASQPRRLFPLGTEALGATPDPLDAARALPDAGRPDAH